MRISNILLLIFLISILFTIIIASYQFDFLFKEWVIIFPAGILFGISFALFTSLFIPGAKAFKFRYLLLGFVFGLGISLMNILSNLHDFKDGVLSIRVLIAVVSGVFGGGCIYGFVSKIMEAPVLKRVVLTLAENENELLRDLVRFDNEEVSKRGVLVLTNQRLVFSSMDYNNREFDSLLSDLTTVSEYYHLGFINGIVLPQNNTRFRMKFPLLWRNELQKRISDK